MNVKGKSISGEVVTSPECGVPQRYFAFLIDQVLSSNCYAKK